LAAVLGVKHGRENFVREELFADVVVRPERLDSTPFVRQCAPVTGTEWNVLSGRVFDLLVGSGLKGGQVASLAIPRGVGPPFLRFKLFIHCNDDAPFAN